MNKCQINISNNKLQRNQAVGIIRLISPSGLSVMYFHIYHGTLSSSYGTPPVTAQHQNKGTCQVGSPLTSCSWCGPGDLGFNPTQQVYCMNSKEINMKSTVSEVEN